jgi:hypothetical protein
MSVTWNWFRYVLNKNWIIFLVKKNVLKFLGPNPELSYKLNPEKIVMDLQHTAHFPSLYPSCIPLMGFLFQFHLFFPFSLQLWYSFNYRTIFHCR